MKTKRNPSSGKPPRPPRTPVVVDDDDDDDDDLPQASVETDLDEELRQVDQELGEDASSAKVVVHKVVPNGDSQRCFSCPRPQFFSDQIREQWGPGTYSIMVYANGRLAKRARLSFAEPLVRPATPAPPAAAVVDPSSAVRDLEARFDRDRARDLEMMKLVIGGRPQLDPLQIQQQTLAMLTSLKDLTGGKPENERSAIDLVLEGVKLAQKLGGGGEGTDWPGIIAGAAEGLRTLAQTEPQRIVATRPRALPAAASANAQPGETPAPADLPGEEDMMDKLKKHLQFLVRKAASQSDPELYAELAIDNLAELPALMRPIALDYLQRPDCLERLIQIEPTVAAHREWFAECVRSIREQISAHLSPQNESPPLTDAADPPDAGD